MSYLKKKLKAVENHQKNFRMQKKVRIDHDVITCDKQDIIQILHDKFEGETIITPYSIKNKRFDAHMPEYKIGI